MKSLKTYLLILLLPASLYAVGQDKRWKTDDILVLKKGNSYTGKIVQIIPDSLYKIEILGGSVIAVPFREVADLYKDKSRHPRLQYQYDTTDGAYYVYTPYSQFYRYRAKGYFMQVHLHTITEFGIDVINGYKFNRYAALGVGVGIHAYFIPFPLTDAAYNCSGGYAPVFLHFGGDILRSRITPYYSLSVGYGIAVRAFHQYSYADYSSAGSYGRTVTLHGGAMGAAGFGVKFYDRHVYPSIGAHLTLQQASYTRDDFHPYGSGVITHTYSTGGSVMIIPSFDIGICF
ncbi:MAG: hypothetical protein JSS76_12675 [Bacteroidetes bacterium]|nr:hypothetical protein [Bacteroidota bacterium]